MPGLLLVVVGGLVVLATSLLYWTYDTVAAETSGPGVSTDYWSGLQWSNLSALASVDRYLYMADAAVTVLCGVAAVLAIVSLAGRSAALASFYLFAGLAAVVVFAIETVRWYTQDLLVFVVALSLAGAIAVVVGAVLVPARARPGEAAVRP